MRSGALAAGTQTRRCPAAGMDNIFTEIGHGFIVDCNYQTDDSSHASIYELNTADPKPWPWEIGQKLSPKVTMDMENLCLANTKQNLAKAWQLAHIQMNFVDLKDPTNVFHIKLGNKETQWKNRGKGHGAHGYQLRGLEVTGRANYVQSQPHDLGMEHWITQSGGTGDHSYGAGHRCT